MKTQVSQLPRTSLPISMMISETAYRIVMGVGRFIRRIPK